jgi:hypothetical protein
LGARQVANTYAALAVTILTISSTENASGSSAISTDNPDAVSAVDAVLIQSNAAVATLGLVLRRSSEYISSIGFTPAHIGLLMSSRSYLLPFRIADVGAEPPEVVSNEGSRYPPRAPSSPNVTISATQIELSSSYITTDSTAFFLESDNMTLGPGSTLSFDGLFTVRANDTIFMDGQALPRSALGVPRLQRNSAIGIGTSFTSELHVSASVGLGSSGMLCFHNSPYLICSPVAAL